MENSTAAQGGTNSHDAGIPPHHEDHDEWGWKPSSRFTSETVYRTKPAQPAQPVQSAQPSNFTELVYRKNENEPATGPPSGPPQPRAKIPKRPKHQTAESPKASKTHQESVDETLLRLSNEFTPIVDQNWDTVIYIGPPPQEHRQDNHEYEYIQQHFFKPYLLNSQTLKDTGSAQFMKFLGPMSARAERRLKKLGIHNRIPQDRKPKFYIDLRPMQDEDEALLMITELACAPGVLSWHLSHLASGVPKRLVDGKDDLNVTSAPYTGSWMEIDDLATNDVDDDEDMSENAPVSNETESGILGLEPEYSALRHYTAIERLIHAIAGGDPRLNSAPKVWTYFSIAKFFDCARNSKVTSWIYDWLFASSNSNFIQANPEVAYRMAMGMRSPDILRTTFAMLVGERALMQASRISSDPLIMSSGNRRMSVHGRTTAHLDDDEINRIDHAAHSLAKRVTGIFHSLTNDLLDHGRKDLFELAKFEFLKEQLPEKQYHEDVWTILCEYVRGEIYQVLSQNVSEGDLLRLRRNRGHKSFGWLKRSKTFADTYNAMPLPQRILTQSFWSQLENYALYQDLEKTTAWSRGHSLDGLNDLAPDLNGEITCVPKATLCRAIESMDKELKKEKQWTELNDKFYDYLYRQEAADVQAPPLSHDSTDPSLDLSRIDSAAAVVWNVDGYKYDANEETYCSPISSTQHRYRAAILATKPPILVSQLSTELRKRIMREILTPGYASEEIGIESEISISQMDILLCLNDSEWKYLPLWADGLDDGTGGVFAEEDVPDMEAIEGFRGGKIGLGSVSEGVGSVGGSFSMADGSEDYDEVMTDEGVSTVGKASRIATDGTTAAGASTVISLDD